MKKSKTYKKITPDGKSKVIKLEPEQAHPLEKLSHENLLKALYWAFDIFERAAMPFFLVYSTAESVFGKKELEGDSVHVGVRINEWTSGMRRVQDSYRVIGDNTFEFTSLEGVPITLHVFEDDHCIRATDSQVYYNEIFQLPNPYSRFLEVYA